MNQKRKEKTATMQAIGKVCGPQSEEHGLILSLPVDGSAGL